MPKNTYFCKKAIKIAVASGTLFPKSAGSGGQGGVVPPWIFIHGIGIV